MTLQLRNMFKLEKQMLDPVLAWCKQMGFHTKSEYRLPWGVCDVVGITFNKQNVDRRIESGQRKPIGSEVRIRLLQSIPDVESNKSVSQQELEREFEGMLSSREINQNLERLIERKFVFRENDDSYKKVNGWMPLHEKIVAIELKLTRIEEALTQATAHLSFADESYVALPMDRAVRVSTNNKAAKFESRGVGLLGVSPTSCKVLVPSVARNSNRGLTATVHCAERFWRTHIISKSA